MADLSRREFAALAAAVAAAPFVPTTHVSSAPAVTAGEVIERIKKNIGVDWKVDSLDTLKAGDVSTVAKGIVTTSMATMTVLQQAVKSGANIVLTAQPTFYARADVPTPPAGRRRSEPGTRARCGLYRQERVHHQEQARRISLE
jgi:hypothetical protein